MLPYLSPSYLELAPDIWVDLIRPIAASPSHLKRIRRSKRILHKLHVQHPPLRLINPTPHIIRAPARLTHRLAPVRKAPKHSYTHQPILHLGGLEPTASNRSVRGTVGPAEDGIDGEFFVSPGLRHSREGANDGIRAFMLVAVGVGEDLLQGGVGVGGRDVRGCGAGEVADDGGVGSLLEEFGNDLDGCYCAYWA